MGPLAAVRAWLDRKILEETARILGPREADDRTPWADERPKVTKVINDEVPEAYWKDENL